MAYECALSNYYEIIKSDRKPIVIQIKPAGQIVVRCPKQMRIEEVRRFVESKSDWIEQLREQARQLVTEPVKYYASIVGVTYNQIAIHLALACSFRVAEICGLTWDCLDISDAAIMNGNDQLKVEKVLAYVKLG